MSKRKSITFDPYSEQAYELAKRHQPTLTQSDYVNFCIRFTAQHQDDAGLIPLISQLDALRKEVAELRTVVAALDLTELRAVIAQVIADTLQATAPSRENSPKILPPAPPVQTPKRKWFQRHPKEETHW